MRGNRLDQIPIGRRAVERVPSSFWELSGDRIERLPPWSEWVLVAADADFGGTGRQRRARIAPLRLELSYIGFMAASGQ
jgi:hypothetical protein